MKKAVFILFLAMCFTLTVTGETFEIHEGDIYRVYSEVGTEHAHSLVKRFEAQFDLYNSVFRFDRNSLPAKLRVRIFDSKGSFDSYLEKIISDEKDSFVFLQYKNPERSELVCFDMGNGEKTEQAFFHHGFIQYLKSFIPNPPLWMLKGFAIYFENSSYDQNSHKAVFQENLNWIYTLRLLLEEGTDPQTSALIPLNLLLSIDISTANRNIKSFFAQTWGLVDFLKNSENRAYNRLLWDSLAVLKPDASKAENEKRIVSRTFQWVDKDKFIDDFIDYIYQPRTFSDLVRKGTSLYNDEHYKEAENVFQRALSLVDNHHIPYYYLGLINYNQGSHTMAEYYYHTAIRMGGSAGLSNYALGVNAYADNRIDDALYYLNESIKSEDSRFVEKSEDLKKRIGKN